MGGDEVLVDQITDRALSNQFDLRYLVRGAESVEEMEERDTGLEGREVGYQGQVLSLLHRPRGEDRESCLACGHDVGVVAKDREGMRRHRAGSHMDHGGGQLAGDLVHVREHQQKALAGGEGRGECACGQGSMDGSGGAALALHLDDVWDDSPEVGPPPMRPCVRQLTHWRGGGDRIDGDHLAEQVGNPCGRLVPVDRCVHGRRVGTHGSIVFDPSARSQGPKARVEMPLWPGRRC